MKIQTSLAIKIAIKLVLILTCLAMAAALGPEFTASAQTKPGAHPAPVWRPAAAGMTLLRLAPSFKMVSSSTFRLTVRGTGFERGAVVYWGADPLVTLYRSKNVLTAVVPHEKLALAGVVNVAVALNGAYTSSLPFTVKNPKPVLNKISPNKAAAGSQGINIALSGSKFTSTSQVFWDDTNELSPVVFDNKVLQVTVPAHYLTTAGTHTLKVTNPAPGGGTSRKLKFTLTPAPAGGTYRLVGWNDLGMHCYNRDFSVAAVLPPYNNLWAQVIKRGDPPEIITAGVTVSYSFPNNTYSVGKSNFWTYADVLFPAAAPLPPNIGLKGKGLAGNMDAQGNHFVAEGIPLTEFSDSAPNTPAPYQLAELVAKDASGNTLANLTVVAPVSTEMHCDTCHAKGKTPGGTSDVVEMNILKTHDANHQANYPVNHTGALATRGTPILCAECHASNALGAAGQPGVSNLSKAMHNHHAVSPDFPANLKNTMTGCYNCHPGPNTRCLRDVMNVEEGMTCISCHGGLADVAAKTNPWLEEPRCSDCHDAPQDNALYRLSTARGVYCEACHDSTHAVAPSREANDGIKFIQLQGRPGPLNDCLVCHITRPTKPMHPGGGD